MTSVTVDKIKVLVSLSGKRLLDFEEEIFADDDLTSEYLYSLLRLTYDHDPGYNDAFVAYWYAKDIIGSRWIEAEHIIQQNSYWWERYVRFVRDVT